MNLKKIFGLLTALMLLAFYSTAQVIQPDIVFDEDTETHNMHICSDGKFLYTINGGKAPEGEVKKYDMDGNYISTTALKLDMRGIIYNKSEDCFYVSCYDRNIYKVLDIETSVYELVYEGIIENEQSALAAHPKDKFFYIMDDGKISMYDFKNGEKVKSLRGFKCGSDLTFGSSTMAVDKKYIYTFDADKKEIYQYKKKNWNYVATYKIAKGDYGFSLSAAGKYIFVAKDGNYATGTWYGYKF